MASSVTYADLDELLVGKGFVCRMLPERHVAYLDRSDEPIFVFPDLPMEQTVQPIHLATVRRWLIELGLSESEEIERWLCQARSDDRQQDTLIATSANGRGSGAG